MKDTKSSTKKSLLASGLALLVCCAMLIGTTFAWFTDNVVNTGNKIQAGTLLINAYAYDIGEDGLSYTVEGINGDQPFTFEKEGQNLKETTAPIINESLWEPGKTSAKLLKVENAGTLAAKIKLDFTTSGDLTGALWFDFIQVGEGNTVTGSFTERPMNTLDTFAENLELPLLENGDSLQFILVYGMYETANNDYQGDSFTADVSILATQHTYEPDGFGSSDYDEDAEWPVIEVSGADDISETIANAPTGSIVNLTEDVTLPAGDSLVISQKDIFINLNGNTLTIEQSGLRPINVKEGASLEIYGNGKLHTETATACIENSGTLTLKNITIENSGNTAIRNYYGTMTIEGCEITAEFYGINNYDGTIESIKNSSIYVSGQGPCAIYNAGASTIREIRDTTITAITTSIFSERAIYNSANSVVENIVNCSTDGKFDLAGNKIGITSGTFKNTKLEREVFEALVNGDYTVTEIEDGYQVTAE